MQQRSKSFSSNRLTYKNFRNNRKKVKTRSRKFIQTRRPALTLTIFSHLPCLLILKFFTWSAMKSELYFHLKLRMLANKLFFKLEWLIFWGGTFSYIYQKRKNSTMTNFFLKDSHMILRQKKSYMYIYKIASPITVVFNSPNNFLIIMKNIVFKFLYWQL